MPELPEVEVSRLSFAHCITGATILAVRLGKPLRWPFGAESGVEPSDIVGRRVLAVRRRGKYILLDLNQGLVLVHLGMSGRLVFFQRNVTAPAKHDHFDLHTSKGVLRLHDPRRFGAVIYAQSQDSPMAKKLLSNLGVEPFGETFTTEFFYKNLHQRTGTIKAVLLSGQPVVGVGNVYASEALFHAGVRPQTSASLISRARADKLHASILSVLQNALDLGGTTLRDFANAQGEDGHFQLQAAVYARAGLACYSCKAPIRMIRQGARSSFYCVRCQRP